MTSPQQWISLGWAPLDAKYRAKRFGKPDPTNPLHVPNHHRPWKDANMSLDPTGAGISTAAGASSSGVNLGKSVERQFNKSAKQSTRRSASPPERAGRGSQSQLHRSASAEAPLSGKRRGVIPYCYDPSIDLARLRPSDTAARMSKLWAYDVQLEKYVSACAKAAQIPETLESDHDDVMDELRELSSAYATPDATAAGAAGRAGSRARDVGARDVGALAAAGIAAYSGVLQQLQKHGHNLKRLGTVRSQRSHAIAVAKQAVEAAVRAVEQRKTDLGASIELLKKQEEAGATDEASLKKLQQQELELKHIVECMPAQAKERSDAKQQEAIGFADLEPKKVEQAAQMTEVVAELRVQFDAARMSCTADAASSQAESRLPIGLMDEISERLGQLGDRGMEMIGGGQKNFLIQVCLMSLFLCSPQKNAPGNSEFVIMPLCHSNGFGVDMAVQLLSFAGLRLAFSSVSAHDSGS